MNSVHAVKLENPFEFIAVIVDDNETFKQDVRPLNVAAPIDVIPFPTETSVIAAQPLKAPAPSIVTEFGMITLPVAIVQP